jgi:hypothetical protein
MISYTQIRPGPGFQPGRAFLYYAQRLVTPPRMRRTLSRCIATGIRLRYGGYRQEQPGASPCRHATASLERDGLAMLPDLVTPAAVDSIAAFFRGKNVARKDGSLVPLKGLPPGTTTAAYPLETVLACRDVLEIINSPVVLRMAANYIGCKPTISSLGVRWSFPSAEPPESTQKLHRDPDDWRFVKLFIYLTDVDQEAGPHVYALGSHKTAATLKAGFYTRAAVESRYGRDNVRAIVGPRGTAFIADTHGIHMGLPPSFKPRLILQVQYSLLPVFALRYEPIALSTGMSLDTYVNRLLLL